MIPVLIVPTLSCRDRLVAMLQSLDHPVEHAVVIDNGRLWPRQAPLNLPEITNIKRLSVIELPANIGVGGGWNLGIKVTPYAPWWLICNDDIKWPPGLLGEVARSARTDAVLKFRGYAVFTIGEEVVTRVGLFDERFHPAYFEDDDYDRRIVLAGMVAVTRDLGLIHAPGSCTLREVENLNHFTFAANKRFNAEKAKNDDPSFSWSLTRRRALGWEPKPND